MHRRIDGEDGKCAKKCVTAMVFSPSTVAQRTLEFSRLPLQEPQKFQSGLTVFRFCQTEDFSRFKAVPSESGHCSVVSLTEHQLFRGGIAAHVILLTSFRKPKENEIMLEKKTLDEIHGSPRRRKVFLSAEAADKQAGRLYERCQDCFANHRDLTRALSRSNIANRLYHISDQDGGSGSGEQ